jgi:hypothetical protein
VAAAGARRTAPPPAFFGTVFIARSIVFRLAATKNDTHQIQMRISMPD